MFAMTRYLVTVSPSSVRTTLTDEDLAAIEARLVHARLYPREYDVRVLLYAYNREHAQRIVEDALRALPAAVPELGVTNVVAVKARRAA